MSVFPMPDLSMQVRRRWELKEGKKSCKKMAPVRSSFRGMILLGWAPGARLLAKIVDSFRHRSRVHRWCTTAALC